MSPIDDYLAKAPEPQRSTLLAVRDIVRTIIPDAEETISYNMPAHRVGGKAVAGYAYFKRHCSWFPHSGSVLPELAEELGDYSWSKGTLQFPIDEPLPAALVKKLIDTRIAQLDR